MTLKIFSILFFAQRGTIIKVYNLSNQLSQPAITCSKLTIETLEQGVKYVQS